MTHLGSSYSTSAVSRPAFAPQGNEAMHKVLAHLDRMQHSIHSYQQGIQIEVAGQPSQPFYMHPEKLRVLDKGFQGLSMIPIETNQLPVPESGPESMTCFFASIEPGGRGDRVRHLHDVRSLILRGSLWLSIGEDGETRQYQVGEALFIPRGVVHTWYTTEPMLSFSQFSPAVGQENA